MKARTVCALQISPRREISGGGERLSEQTSATFTLTLLTNRPDCGSDTGSLCALLRRQITFEKVTDFPGDLVHVRLKRKMTRIV